MSSAMLLERSALGAGHSPAPFGSAIGSPSAAPANWCIVPRCNIQVEKCQGGLKLRCVCEDEVATATLQNLCKMLADGLCSCSCTWNGICICQCNLACGNCACEYTHDGVSITCTSGDKACCDMLQACCECLSKCLKNGCCCYVSFGNTPVCCGCSQ